MISRLELVVEPWLEGLWPVLKKELQKIVNVDAHVHTEHIAHHKNGVTTVNSTPQQKTFIISSSQHKIYAQ